ncbi:MULTISPECIES: right-handed parallel beta-helix repeat-containing protein [Streptomyces]|uniref:right-handed parallel beta-helix repeat-containing protein n=1 Tax=Streptomyces TaxID=1883 RepID=UPI0022AEEFAC|nr:MULTISPECIES: right-handed parallel beta-helix repeat-containing protein [Streptomyces]MCZ4095577.1 right-handed parallel beta-helix repeat-containing protein [Streptomyces sp. H39-C1]
MYVNNAASAHCTDTGSGLEAKPFCTVSAAVAAVQPGQTVHIAPQGTYPEQVNLTKSGTEAAPITLVGDPVSSSGVWSSAYYSATIGKRDAGGTARGLTISGAQHIRIKSLNFAAVDEGVRIENSSDVSYVSGWVTGAATAAVHVLGTSEKVTVGRLNLDVISGPGIVVDPGVKGAVLTTNHVNAYDGDGISVTDSPGAVVVGNSVFSRCHDGIVLAGASSGATIANNVIAPTDVPGWDSFECFSEHPTRLTVAPGSVTGTKTDYNVLSTIDGRSAYNWAGTAYGYQPAFRSATGQGTHDFFADPLVPWKGDKHAKPLPAIDSADITAPGMLDVDSQGNKAVDDPLTPNSGGGHRDRGAREWLDVGSLYTPQGPTRLLDTRSSHGDATQLPTAVSMQLQVTGRNGVPATGVTAVTLNVTATGTTGAGFLAVYPTYSKPIASNLNWAAGDTVANLVTVPVDDNGRITIQRGGQGTTDVIADLAGYYSAKGSVFTTAGPTRAMDTRNGTGAPQGAVRSGGSVDLQIAGTNGVPATGVTAVTLNVTTTAPTAYGFLTVYPHGATRPVASNLNWAPGRTVANLVTVPVVDGKVSFYSGGTGPGTVQVIADVAGYYSGQGHNTFHAETPFRVLDTRKADLSDCTDQDRPAAVIPPGGTLDVALNCYQTSDTTSLTLNVTVTGTGAPGFLTVYPHGRQKPVASNINWIAGQTVPNQVVVPIGDGKISFFNGSGGNIDLVVDVLGYHSV